MSFLSQLYSFYIRASVHVAVAATCMVYVINELFRIPHSTALMYFVFLGTLAGYNGIKYMHRSGWVWPADLPYPHTMGLLTLGAGAFSLLYVPRLNLSVLIALGIAALVSILYVRLPGVTRNLRGVPGLKVFLVALVWALVTFALPWLQDDRPLHPMFWQGLGLQWLLVVAWCLPFEIRDLSIDADTMLTLPRLLGLTTTRILGVALIAVWTFTITQVAVDFHWSVFVFATLLAAILAFMPKHNNWNLVSFWCEGLPILWWLLLVVV